MSADAAEPMVLSTPRHAGALIMLTLELFLRHAGLFLALTLLVVAPATLGIVGIWAGGLWEGGGYELSAAQGNALLALTSLVLPALITALHCVVVRDLGEGRVPRFASALRAAAPRFGIALAVVALYGALVFAGLVALIVPGLLLAVAWYFGAQVAVLEQLGPWAALKRSWSLVSGRWWSTFGALLLSGLAYTVPGTILTLMLAAIDNGLLYTVALTLAQAVMLSLTALFGTLLYFSHRATRP
jgi:hypothetical protein